MPHRVRDMRLGLAAGFDAPEAPIIRIRPIEDRGKLRFLKHRKVPPQPGLAHVLPLRS